MSPIIPSYRRIPPPTSCSVSFPSVSNLKSSLSGLASLRYCSEDGPHHIQDHLGLDITPRMADSDSQAKKSNEHQTPSLIALSHQLRKMENRTIEGLRSNPNCSHRHALCASSASHFLSGFKQTNHSRGHLSTRGESPLRSQMKRGSPSFTVEVGSLFPNLPEWESDARASEQAAKRLGHHVTCFRILLFLCTLAALLFSERLLLGTSCSHVFSKSASHSLISSLVSGGALAHARRLH